MALIGIFHIDIACCEFNTLLVTLQIIKLDFNIVERGGHLDAVTPIHPAICAQFFFNRVGICHFFADGNGFILGDRSTLDPGSKLLLESNLAQIHFLTVGFIGQIETAAVVTGGIDLIRHFAKLIEELLLLTGRQLAITLTQFDFSGIEFSLTLEQDLAFFLRQCAIFQARIDAVRQVVLNGIEFFAVNRFQAGNVCALRIIGELRDLCVCTVKLAIKPGEILGGRAAFFCIDRSSIAGDRILALHGRDAFFVGE